MNHDEILAQCVGFEWDRYNTEKIRERHGVSPSECEQLFFNLPLIVEDDERHSQSEMRFYALGHTNAKRFLFVVFTIRNQKVRIISARDMNRKERKIYQTDEKENSSFQE